MNFSALKNLLLCFITICMHSLTALAGPFPPAAGQTDSTAIGHDDPSIAGWADAVEIYTAGSDVDVSFQTPQKALGIAGSSDGLGPDFTFDIVSLGRGGSITLSFNQPIANGSGADFAIFENSFSDTFLELAWVEVSENGVDFYRFPAVSLTNSAVSGFGTVDPTDITGFAGKYRASFGTPFDLQDVFDANSITLASISYVRIIDIVGDTTAPNSPDNVDSIGNRIYDPFPTSLSAGFDLDAVAVIHFAEPPVEENVPIPPVFVLLLAILIAAISSCVGSCK